MIFRNIDSRCSRKLDYLEKKVGRLSNGILYNRVGKAQFSHRFDEERITLRKVSLDKCFYDFSKIRITLKEASRLKAIVFTLFSESLVTVTHVKSSVQAC